MERAQWDKRWEAKRLRVMGLIYRPGVDEILDDFADTVYATVPDKVLLCAVSTRGHAVGIRLDTTVPKLRKPLSAFVLNLNLPVKEIENNTLRASLPYEMVGKSLHNSRTFPAGRAGSNILWETEGKNDEEIEKDYPEMLSAIRFYRTVGGFFIPGQKERVARHPTIGGERIVMELA